jgi:hypothetical protein
MRVVDEGTVLAPKLVEGGGGGSGGVGLVVCVGRVCCFD